MTARMLTPEQCDAARFLVAEMRRLKSRNAYDAGILAGCYEVILRYGIPAAAIDPRALSAALVEYCAALDSLHTAARVLVLLAENETDTPAAAAGVAELLAA